MEQKTRLLVVIDSLAAAGAERSLLTFLSVLDYQSFEVDLQLFRYGGELERYLPLEVNLLPPLRYTRFLGKTLAGQLRSLEFRHLLARCAYSLSIRLSRCTHADRARKYWKTVGRVLPATSVHYDVAIAYAQGIPTFYVADKVNASLKMAWVNIDYRLAGKNKDFQARFYHSLDHIVCVTEVVKSVFGRVYPDLEGRMTVVRDMLDEKTVHRLANLTMPDLDQSVPVILTIGRLSLQKGYDLAIRACHSLARRGLKFKWYAIGRGPLQEQIEEQVRSLGIEDRFVLLGVTDNPYPYLKACDLYVQTSRHEGYGLAIAEARMLDKPVVTTDFEAACCQMVQGKNGLVVSQEAEAIADGIERLLSDRALYQSMVAYLQKEKKGNTEEIEKFYRLLSTE